MGYEKSDWERHWREESPPWNLEPVNAELIQLYPELSSTFGICSDARVLIPFCGDTGALRFLYDQGHPVTGVEFVREPLERVKSRDFPELHFTADARGYSAPRVDLVLGDFLQLSDPPYDLIYDAAALVAVHPRGREPYLSALDRNLKVGGFLLIKVTETIGSRPPGPPYSVSEETLRALFSGYHEQLFHVSTVPPTVQRFIDGGVTDLRHAVALFQKKE